MTPEEMQAEIIRLTDELKNTKTELETSKTDNTAKDARILGLQEHNQKLFLRITTQEDPAKLKKPEENPTTVEDVADIYFKRKKEDK
jgi:hypothetical protein